MLYSDDELKLWWSRLSKQSQEEILDTMIEKSAQQFQGFAESIKRSWSAGFSLSAKQLASIKKWDR